MSIGESYRSQSYLSIYLVLNTTKLKNTIENILCTFSSSFMLFEVTIYMDPKQHYNILNVIQLELQAFSFIDLGVSTRFAFLVAPVMCSFQQRSALIVTPRYIEEFTDHSSTPKVIQQSCTVSRKYLSLF